VEIKCCYFTLASVYSEIEDQ